MYAKSIILLAVASIVASRDVEVGSKLGVKIFDERREASPAIWRQKADVIIQANDTEVISGIVIKDGRPEKDGEVIIVEGGVGQPNVTVELKSPSVFRGYDFHIEVYAVPENESFTINKSLPIDSPIKSNSELLHPGVVSSVPQNSDTKVTNGKHFNIPITVEPKNKGINQENDTKIIHIPSENNTNNIEDKTKIIAPISEDADIHEVKAKVDAINPLVSPLDVSSSIEATKMKTVHKRELGKFLRFGK